MRITKGTGVIDFISKQVLSDKKTSVAVAVEKGVVRNGNRGDEIIPLKTIFSEQSTTEKQIVIYAFAKDLLEHTAKAGFKHKSMFFSTHKTIPSVLIQFSEKDMLNDEFVSLTYTYLHNLQETYFEIAQTPLDISFIGGDEVDLDLLESDGYYQHQEV